MLRGWIQSKSANASTHSLDILAEPQHCTEASLHFQCWLYILTYIRSGDSPSRYHALPKCRPGRG